MGTLCYVQKLSSIIQMFNNQKDEIMKMKLALLLSFLFMMSVYAQQPVDKMADRVKEKTEKLAKELSLTDSQKEKVHQIVSKYDGKMAELKMEGKEEKQEMKTKFMELQQNCTAEMKTVLNADQFSKYTDMMKSKADQVKEKFHRRK